MEIKMAAFERDTLSSGKKGASAQIRPTNYPPKEAVSHPGKWLD